jgi:hypothetical protein
LDNLGPSDASHHLLLSHRISLEGW